MEDEEGYTALNLRPTASVITPGYLSSKKCSAFKAPASCVTVDSKYRWKLTFLSISGYNMHLQVHDGCFKIFLNFIVCS